MHPVNTAINRAQVENTAGGFVYQLTDLERLKRFLILGSDSNTFYASAKVRSLCTCETDAAIRTPDLSPTSVSYNLDLLFSHRT